MFNISHVAWVFIIVRLMVIDVSEDIEDPKHLLNRKFASTTCGAVAISPGMTHAPDCFCHYHFT